MPNWVVMRDKLTRVLMTHNAAWAVAPFFVGLIVAVPIGLLAAIITALA